MKARYIREAKAINPLYDVREHRRAKAEGRDYDVDQLITIPIGFEEEGPQCWAHCCPGYKGEPPVCEPADDECRARVQKWMEVERPMQLDRIRQAAHPANLKKMKPKEQQHILDLCRVYGLEMPSASDPVVTPKPEPRPEPAKS
ncbi:hypothetical protein KOR42_06120 [Thalassoglobus neptunius]|uniref:Uncharacterized protein n=1 Tax=Thalassoglobus neptunius TaxID=1938619 RepID=A0A5C5X298_9PLAN|nr:hypothetical protein [Thalassoglobus neptunius]TWT57254.1 hypothetical protein KOR42_06120 [Thalassoglobus neptunius]